MLEQKLIIRSFRFNSFSFNNSRKNSLVTYRVMPRILYGYSTGWCPEYFMDILQGDAQNTLWILYRVMPRILYEYCTGWCPEYFMDIVQGDAQKTLWILYRVMPRILYGYCTYGYSTGYPRILDTLWIFYSFS